MIVRHVREEDVPDQNLHSIEECLRIQAGIKTRHDRGVYLRKGQLIKYITKIHQCTFTNKIDGGMWRLGYKDQRNRITLRSRSPSTMRAISAATCSAASC